ncbi:MAG: hypothetical protein UR26_C0002G0083 [candidate division TM6 bacterium GW2011_GWF2_32_72]|nr:MAG: hypothetical protein UR26_C0002G0083 [candidate division TM6 bacterium GW2011_GWF2_32_72]
MNKKLLTLTLSALVCLNAQAGNWGSFWGGAGIGALAGTVIGYATTKTNKFTKSPRTKELEAQRRSLRKNITELEHDIKKNQHKISTYQKRIAHLKSRNAKERL